MKHRNPIQVTIVTKFTLEAPTEDELINRALDAGIDGDEPSPEELDAAYEAWKEEMATKFEDGDESAPDAVSTVEIEEKVR